MVDIRIYYMARNSIKGEGEREKNSKNLTNQVQAGGRGRERNYTCPGEVIAVKAPGL